MTDSTSQSSSQSSSQSHAVLSPVKAHLPTNEMNKQAIDAIVKEIKSNTANFDPSKPCVWSSAFAGKLLQGTAGWTDTSINQASNQAHKFYPNWVKNAVDRLKHYCQYFPMVEVDTSNYSIPTITQSTNWTNAVHDGFLFHYKIFGLFTMGSCQFNAIPGVLREQCINDLSDNSHSDKSSSNDRVNLSDLSQSFKQLIWDHWNKVIDPVHRANKLGITIFQFQTGFSFNDVNMQHIRGCRSGLDARYRMGVEFRDRSWVSDQSINQTIQFLRDLDITLIAEDDLAQEVHNIRGCTTASNQSLSSRLPIILRLTSSHSMYIRMHRRVGDQRGDRVLHDYEFDEWRTRLLELYEQDDHQPKRTYFFSIGTDCMDDPITNARLMDEALADTPLVLSWHAIATAITDSKQSSIIAMFNKQQQSNKRIRSESNQDDQVIGLDDESSSKRADTKSKSTKSNPSSSTTSSTKSSQASNSSSTSSPRSETTPSKKQKTSALKNNASGGTPSITSFFQRDK